jgi:transposase
LVRYDDGRRLDHATLQALRIHAVRRIVAGERPEQVATALGFARSTVFAWLARYQAGGMPALAARPVPGRPARLSGTQCERLYALIVGGGPREFGLGPALWTRDRVRALIARDLHVTLSEASVGRVLRRLGIAAPRPQVEGCVAAMRPVRPPDVLLYAGAAAGPVRFAVYPGPVGESVRRDFLARLRQDVGAAVSVSWSITVDNRSAYL